MFHVAFPTLSFNRHLPAWLLPVSSLFASDLELPPVDSSPGDPALAPCPCLPLSSQTWTGRRWPPSSATSGVRAGNPVAGRIASLELQGDRVTLMLAKELDDAGEDGDEAAMTRKAVKVGCGVAGGIAGRRPGRVVGRSKAKREAAQTARHGGGVEVVV